MTKLKEEVINFYFNKKVLITGHTGFKGGWLTLFLKMMGAEILGISDTRKNISIKSGFDSSLVNNEIITDINNVVSYKKEVSDFKPDLVFYLAAEPLVREAYKNPVKTINTNVMGLTNFLHSIKDLKSTKLIFTVTSDKVYEHRGGYNKFVETDRLGGVEPYGTSKAMQEMIVKTFYESYFKQIGTKMITARAGNVLGGGDWGKDRLIVDIVNSIIFRNKMEVRFPNNTRPWQHVIELIFGYLMLTATFYKDNIGFDSFNFAPEKSYPTQKILDFSKKYWKDKFNYYVSTDKNLIFEETRLQISNKKIENYINWTSDRDLVKTLDNTFNWYKAHLNKDNLYELNKSIVGKFLGI